MKQALTIAHLYPREMNIYGDLGNVIALQRRLEWRGITPRVVHVEAGEPVDWEAVDVVFGGGGQDSGQLVVGQDLLRHGSALRQMAEDGVPMLVICGTYQLFGHGFTTVEGQEIPGIGVFDMRTVGGTVRMIGNMVVETEAYGQLVGFENHSGQTILAARQAPLGTVIKGAGNNPHSRQEGAQRGMAIGTYLHGPVLPKNSQLADALLGAALRRRYGVTELEPLDDALERAAARVAASRPR
ncbi:MAG TPA: glutamine amidotransferase [Candidatus Saccharimonadia bacterium]